MSNKKTPKAKARRISQLKRLGYDQDIIDDIIYLEFGGGMIKAPGAPLPGKKYNQGGKVRIF
jgi:hypothetical protein